MSPSPSPQARDLFADALEQQGPAWKNAADSVRAGQYANAWVNAALRGIDDALRYGPDDTQCPA